MKYFLQELAVQRWDDHRFYHHSRINQTLHLVSALAFLAAYGLVFVDPAMAALLGWGVSMTARQAGHFFFEPRGYDHVNRVSDEYKEAVKVGYNIRRKVVLMGVWAALPLLLWWQPALFGAESRAPGELLQALGIAWLALGIGGLMFRVAQLTITRRNFTGLVWLCKILTDPLHDIKLYHRAPLYLLQGKLVDPAHRAH